MRRCLEAARLYEARRGEERDNSGRRVGDEKAGCGMVHEHVDTS